jgi:hypothetical protein
MKLYRVKEVGSGSNVIPYVDDGDIIIQSPTLQELTGFADCNIGPPL